MFFNTHTHLNSKEQYERIDELIKNALDNNVNRMTVVGYNVESSKKALEIAKEYDFIYATVGISPNDLDEPNMEDLKVIESLLNSSKVVALGEIGLDYYYDTDQEVQKIFFKEQCLLAKKYNLPVVIHCRDAYEDTFNILKETGVKGIMHCYSGSVEMAKRFIKLGFYISLSGTVTFKNAKVPKNVAKEIPIEWLLIETDDPYLTPVPFRGKRNEPGYCIYVAQEIANQKEITIEEVEESTFKNALKVFNIEE